MRSAIVWRQLSDELADYTAFTVATNGKREDVIVATTREDLSHPAELFVFDPKTKSSRQLTQVNGEALKALKMGEVRKRMVKATDGKDILTWVVYPPNFDASKSIRHCSTARADLNQWLVSSFPTDGTCNSWLPTDISSLRRIVADFPDSEKRGTTISRKIRGGQPMRDLISAIDDVAKEPYVNKDKLGAVGASFGGYSVSGWPVITRSDSSASFPTMVSITWNPVLRPKNPFSRSTSLKEISGRAPNLRATSSFTPKFVQFWDTPILIIANEKDYRVPYTQGLEAFRRHVCVVSRPDC